MSKEIIVAIITGVFAVITTLGVQWFVNRSNVKVANIETYPDVAQQLREALDQSQQLNRDLIAATRELSMAREAIQSLTSEVVRLKGDASAGLAYLKSEEDKK